GLTLDEKIYKQLVHNRWDFSSSTLSRSTLTNIPSNEHAEGGERQFVFDKSNIRNTKFDKSDLSLSSFADARIEDKTSFQEAKLFDANFTGAYLNNVDFFRADLSADNVAWLYAKFS